jgi:low affinity Fe/Cu permease
MNRALFWISEQLSKPPGFYVMLLGMAACSAAVVAGFDYNLITFALSVLAIVITGVVLVQGFRDTAAIQAKLDELILAVSAARNEMVGLEKREAAEIELTVAELEAEAEAKRGPDNPCPDIPRGSLR